MGCLDVERFFDLRIRRAEEVEEDKSWEEGEKEDVFRGIGLASGSSSRDSRESPVRRDITESHLCHSFRDSIRAAVEIFNPIRPCDLSSSSKTCLEKRRSRVASSPNRIARVPSGEAPSQLQHQPYQLSLSSLDCCPCRSQSTALISTSLADTQFGLSYSCRL